MLLINTPGTFFPERKYILDVLLGEILGLDYRIEPKSQQDYEFLLPGHKKLIVRDHFFSSIPTDTGYLKKSNIPTGARFIKNRFVKGEDIPVLYGTDQLEVTRQQVVCGIDLFASAFFMLSRWEEYADETRDSHQRFPAAASLAYKQGFLDRPLVNEYAEMLRQMLDFLDCRLPVKEKPFSLVLTHDVDALLKWLDWKQVLRTFAGDMIKRGQVRTAFSRISEYEKIRQGKIKDPFDTYDWLMDLSESLNLKSHFYFMSGGLSNAPEDNHSPYPPHHPRTREIIKRIKKRGHSVGFHPGYGTYRDEAAWADQKERLEKAIDLRLTIGRQHYLRFRVPDTWQIWENRKMETDSTLGYADREGFRCGTGHRYSVFNILTREKLGLKEQPLIFMDKRNFFCGGYEGKSLFEHHLSRVIANARTFHTPVTLLFHNNVFTDPGFVRMYEEILKMGT